MNKNYRKDGAVELLKGKRACWVVLVSVTGKDGSAYQDDDWRAEYIGKRGWFEFRNHSFSGDAYHTVGFSDCEEEDDRSWSIHTGEIIGIKEDVKGVTLITANSKYRFLNLSKGNVFD